MNSPRYQQGMGFSGWLIIILLFGGVLTVGLKLFPLYLDHNTISGVMNGIANEPSMDGRGDKAIEDMMIKHLKINNSQDFPVPDELKIKRDRSGITMSVNYEKRVALIGNIDLVASFQHSEAMR
tara:strand:- start:38 stop:409 length:372 start_codon:yes stop_codon:yes gene_type:complete